MAESLNRAAKHVIVGSGTGGGAMQLTPKADKAKIKATLMREVGASKASEGLKIYKNQYGTFSRRTTRRKGARGNSMLKFIALKQLHKMGVSKPSDKAIEARMAKILAARTRAAGYTAFAGWNKAAIALGARGIKGIDPKRFGKSEARHGSATKATKDNLQAIITNTAPMAETLGWPALQRGIDNAAKDLLAYARKKLEKAGKEAGF